MTKYSDPRVATFVAVTLTLLAITSGAHAQAPLQQTQLTAGDGAASDNFGVSVSLDGDTALVGSYADDVGANVNQGSVYVFTRVGGVWTQQARLIAVDGAADDLFGFSVALSGDTALVGAYRHNVGANADQGSAYVFKRVGTAWTQQQQLTAADGAAGDFFGDSVALSGNTALVGADGHDIGANVNQGAAYVFGRTGGIWTAQQKLTAGDGADGDNFGVSVALRGDTALVGADADDVGANASQGSAYVFSRVGGVWNESAQLISGDGAPFDLFGVSVALSGNTALVGAAGDDLGANVDQGSAYVFTESGGAWAEQAKLTAIDGAASDFFGISVALRGNKALVGAAFYDLGAKANQGSAYVFRRVNGVWTYRRQLTAANGAAFDNFGTSVALGPRTSLVGANRHDVGANADQGAAYLFTRLRPTSKDQCKSGGWQTFGVFKNQGDCVSFVATKVKN